MLETEDLFRRLGRTMAGETGCHDHRSHIISDSLPPALYAAQDVVEDRWGIQG